MIILKECCSGSLRIVYNKSRKRFNSICFIVFLFLIWFFFFRKVEKVSDCFQNCRTIDVVYTWVNGSDPLFIENIKKYDTSFDPARFDDKNELRFSLRSLEKFAPWVRHVYIVTNGQIPYWLDLSYDKVTIVPHSQLIPDKSQLPTFSSSAIETFIHRIPNLSKQFLYLNDDIFLGEPLYPDDLFTESQGVKIFQAWLVPDCADDCPWTYIGDGACDRHCNITQCQFDGGDCATAPFGSFELVDHFLSGEIKKPENKSQPLTVTYTRQPIVRKITTKRARFKMNARFRNSSTFKDLIKTKNLTKPDTIQETVAQFNKMKQYNKNFGPPTKNPYSHLDFNEIHIPFRLSKPYQPTKNIFSSSLIYTNMLLNQHYGFKARNVLAHVGFFLDKDIINEMQKKFAKEVYLTTSHRFRSKNDLQFAFLYYSYVMSETRAVSVEEIFQEFDTDASNSWSDREIRTLLARMYPLPLEWSSVRFFEEVINECYKDLTKNKKRKNDVEENEENDDYVHPTLVYERYEGSTLPKISKHLVLNCPLLNEALLSNFGKKPKYKHFVHPRRASDSNFMMLISNVTEVIDDLDKFRKNMKKFNCINDNLEPEYESENVLVRHLLEDFYVSFFPKPSKFELHNDYRNRFDNWDEYENWKKNRYGTLVICYCFALISFLIVIKFVYDYKSDFIQQPNVQ